MGLSRGPSENKPVSEQTPAGGEKRDFGAIMSESAAAAHDDDNDEDSDDLF